MGTTAAETFESGTLGAASGGTTMIVDFCLPGPDGSSRMRSMNGTANRAADLHRHVGYHMAITGWNESIFNEMKERSKHGVNTFKHFMAYKGALMVDDDEIFAASALRRTRARLPLVHAENGDMVAEMQQQILEQGITGPEGHAYSRPPEVEGEAANRAIMIADAAACQLYIVHVELRAGA
jgi:dihydropyrimidinase